jgi:hypothetical protein
VDPIKIRYTDSLTLQSTTYGLSVVFRSLDARNRYLDQRVQAQMTHLNEKYELLTTDYEELRRSVMMMRS